MKVKNIMFSGFAAAILMGVAAEANAVTAKVVASKGYVDAITGQLGELGGAAAGKTNLVDAVNAKLDPVDAAGEALDDGEYYSSVTQATDGQVTVVKGELATTITDGNMKAPTTDAVHDAIQGVTYTDGTDIEIGDNNAINATYESLDYMSTTDTANNANQLTNGYAVSYVAQENGKVSIGAKEYNQVVNATSAEGQTGRHAPSTAAVYNALEDKQDALDTDQLAAVNSGVTSDKVTTYDGYATSKQNALDADQLAAVDSGITAEKVTAYDGYATSKQDALDADQLAAVDSGITAEKVTAYDGYATSKQDTLTTAQQSAVDSGITAEKVTAYDGYATSKQDTLSEGQLAAVNSGITAEKVAAFEAKQDALDTDQLAAVNSGITAEKVAAFEAKQDALTTAQLAAVNSGITSDKVTTYDGYATSKQNALSEGQLAAVNSGITAGKVAQYDAIPVMPTACQEEGVVCVLSSEAGEYMWSVLVQPYTYTSGEETVVTDGLTAQKQMINTNVN